MPRRKITEPATDSPDDLPEISPQQQEFVRGLLSGKTASDAYRSAFDCSDWLPNSVWCAASKLANDARVQQWLDAARRASLGGSTRTLDHHVRELERLKALCVQSGNMGAAVTCEQTIGKATGLHIDRIQEVPADPEQTLKTLAITAPDLAAQLAAAAGIPWATADEHATKH